MGELEHGISDSWATAPEPFQRWSCKRWVQSTCPILAFYRSQHDQQSWVEALTVILDTCALILTAIDGVPVTPARFTFAMARHAVVDLAQVLNTTPIKGVNRLSSTEFTRLQDMLAVSAIRLKEGTALEQKLAELRATYEPS